MRLCVTSNKLPVTIHNIILILTSILHLAVTPANITSGFKITEIQPLNPLIFSKVDFMQSYATERQKIISFFTNRPTYAFGKAEVTDTYEPSEYFSQ